MGLFTVDEIQWTHGGLSGKRIEIEEDDNSKATYTITHAKPGKRSRQVELIFAEVDSDGDYEKAIINQDTMYEFPDFTEPNKKPAKRKKQRGKKRR